MPLLANTADALAMQKIQRIADKRVRLAGFRTLQEAVEAGAVRSRGPDFRSLVGLTSIIPGSPTGALLPLLGSGTMPTPAQQSFTSMSANTPTLGQTAEQPWWITLGGAVIDLFGNRSQPSPQPQVQPQNGNQLTAGCPTGYVWNASTGTCEKSGIRGTVERILPGGSTGTLTPQFGQAVVGAFGVPALVPAQVGQTLRGPILRCPYGAVLGKDDLCYQRSSIPRRFRKWKPRAKPPVTASDAKAIRQADSAKNRVERLAKSTGLYVRRSAPRRRLPAKSGAHRH